VADADAGHLHRRLTLYEGSRFNPLVNPVAISILLLTGLLAGTGTPYATYFEGAQFVHFLLGPAPVALAVPLYEQMPKLRAPGSR